MQTISDSDYEFLKKAKERERNFLIDNLHRARILHYEQAHKYTTEQLEAMYKP